MRRLLVLAAVLVAAVLVQSTVLAGLRLAGVRPDLLVLAVVAVAMASDATTGAVFGFVTGLVADLLFDPPVGVGAGLHRRRVRGRHRPVYVTSHRPLVHLVLAARRPAWPRCGAAACCCGCSTCRWAAGSTGPLVCPQPAAGPVRLPGGVGADRARPHRPARRSRCAPCTRRPPRPRLAWASCPSWSRCSSSPSRRGSGTSRCWPASALATWPRATGPPGRGRGPRGRILDREGRVVVRNRAAWRSRPARRGGRPPRGPNARLGRRHDQGPAGGADRRLHRLAPARHPGGRGRPHPPALPPDRARPVPRGGLEVLALREYLAGPAAAHVLGYVGEISADELKQRQFRGYEAGDIVGKAGVELTYDKWLRGPRRRPGPRGQRRRGGGAASAAARPSLVATSSSPSTSNLVSVERALAEHAAPPGACPTASGAAPTRPRPPPRSCSTSTAPCSPWPACPSDPRRLRRRYLPARLRPLRQQPGQPLLHRAVQSVYPPGLTRSRSPPWPARSGFITPTSTYHCPGRSPSQLHQAGLTPRGHGRSGSPTACGSPATSTTTTWRPARRGRAGPGGAGREGRREDAGHPHSGSAALRPRPPVRGRGHGADREWRKRFWEENRKTWCAGSSALYRELCRDGWRWQGGDNLNVAIGQGDLQVSPLQPPSASAGQWRHRLPAPRRRAVLDPASGRAVRWVAPGSPWPRCRARPSPSARGWPACPRGTAASAPSPGSRWTGPGGRQDRHRRPAAPGPVRLVRLLRPGGGPRYVVVVMVEQGGWAGGESAAPVAGPSTEAGPGPGDPGPGADRDDAGVVGSLPDRVSRLGWEQASDRPMAWRAPWRHLDLTVLLAALALTALGLAAIYLDLRRAPRPGAARRRPCAASCSTSAWGWPSWWRPWWSTTAASRPGPGWCSGPWWWPSGWS